MFAGMGLAGVEVAMLADEIEATEGITRLAEDENEGNGIFTEAEATLDFTDFPEDFYL